MRRGKSTVDLLSVRIIWSKRISILSRWSKSLKSFVGLLR